MKIQAKGALDVYIAELPDVEPTGRLCCAQRQEEVSAVSNQRVRREKYYIWKLLEYALKSRFDVDPSMLCFKKSENGKWSVEGYGFSLSHSGKALAVAVFDENVGVDVEQLRVKSAERFADYILTEREKEKYSVAASDNQEMLLVQKWCEKEAIFKLGDEKSFVPSRIESDSACCDSSSLELCGERYVLAVAAKSFSGVNKIFVEAKCLL